MAADARPAASGLVRLSREAGDTNLSLPGMKDDIRALADRLGVDLPESRIHVDDGISGAVRDRPGFTAWLDDARSGRVSVLLTPYVDRVTREGVNAVGLVFDVLEGKDERTGAVVRPPVRLVTVDGVDGSGDDEGFRWRMIGQAEGARSERKSIVRRNKANRSRMHDARRWVGGPVPYGYSPAEAPDGAGKILVPNPEEAAVVRRITEEIIAGRSLYSIAVGLNADGIAAASRRTLRDADGEKVRDEHGKPVRIVTQWSRATVRSLARSEHILGRVALVHGDEATRERRPLLDKEGLPVIAWAPLVDLASAEQVRALTQSTPTPGRAQATIAGRRTRASRLLSGLLSCTCDAPLVVRRRKGLAYYGCADRARGLAKKDKPCLLVDAERVEDRVTGLFLAAVGALPVVEEIVRTPAVAGLAEARRDLAEASSEIPNTSPANLPPLLERITALSARVESLSALPSEPVVEVVETGETFADRWHRLDDVDARRRLLALSGVIVDIAPARRRGFWDPDRVSVTFVDSEESRLADYAD